MPGTVFKSTINSFNCHNKPVKEGLPASPFLTAQETDAQRGSLPKVTQPRRWCSQAGFKPSGSGTRTTNHATSQTELKEKAQPGTQPHSTFRHHFQMEPRPKGKRKLQVYLEDKAELYLHTGVSEHSQSGHLGRCLLSSRKE